MQRNLSPVTNLAIGAGAVTMLAFLSAAFFASHPRRELLPIFFIFVVLAIALRFGSGAGVAGTLLTAAVFAYLLFLPAGSFRITDAAARNNIGWLIMGGVSLSFLFGYRPRPQEPLPTSRSAETPAPKRTRTAA